MKFVLCLFLLSCLICGAEDTAIQKSLVQHKTESFQKDMKSQASYRKFITLFKQTKGQINEKVIAIGILGARMHKLKTEYDLFTKMMKTKYPLSDYPEKIKTKNLGVVCAKCNGDKKSMRSCTKCKGKKTCTNSSCKGGSVKGYDRKNGRYVPVERTCSICNGTGNCVTCEGSGEVSGSCSPCRQRGYVFSSEKAYEFMDGVLNEIVTLQVAGDQVAFEKAQEAKGLIKLDGEWVTQKYIQQMKDRAAEAEKQRLIAEKREEAEAAVRRMNQRAEALIKQSDARLAEDADEFVELLKIFIADNPKCASIELLKKELQYSELYSSAMKFEESGDYGKAVEVFTKALAIKASKELEAKIKELDDQDIGL